MIEIPREHRRLFPMHLAPIDWLFFLDDFPDYPMSFFVELHFTGCLDRGKFDAALEQALSRHPLLFSKVLPGKRDQLCWTPAPEQAATIRWLPWDDTLQAEAAGEFIDLGKQTGLRVWGRRDEQRCRVTMQFHHATCDGTGAYRFIGDLLACYYLRTEEGADKAELGESDWSLLRHRRSKMGDLSERAGVWKLLPRAFAQYRRYAEWISPVGKPAAAPAQRPFPNLAVESLDPELLPRLRAAAVARGAMLNDLLLCEFFRTLTSWNNSTRGKIRVMVPSDMRDKGDFGMPAANMTAYTFLTRRGRDVAGDGLLDSICRETMEIKNGVLQRQFMDSMFILTAKPRVARFFFRRNTCLATAVLSNAGDPSRRFLSRLPKRRGVISCSGVTLESITGAPPVRRNTRASMSVSSYGRRLALTLRCDPNLFATEDCERLLGRYIERLRQVPADPSSAAGNNE